MPPRSQLEINTSSVLRLVKEEASYHREAVEQAERIKKLENDKSEDENREYLLQQEVCLSTQNPHLCQRSLGCGMLLSSLCVTADLNSTGLWRRPRRCSLP
jgi:hypothetical protein